jgi:hypothetical protein
MYISRETQQQQQLNYCFIIIVIISIAFFKFHTTYYSCILKVVKPIRAMCVAVSLSAERPLSQRLVSEGRSPPMS